MNRIDLLGRKERDGEILAFCKEEQARFVVFGIDGGQIAYTVARDVEVIEQLI